MCEKLLFQLDRLQYFNAVMELHDPADQGRGYCCTQRCGKACIIHMGDDDILCGKVVIYIAGKGKIKSACHRLRMPMVHLKGGTHVICQIERDRWDGLFFDDNIIHFINAVVTEIPVGKGIQNTVIFPVL